MKAYVLREFRALRPGEKKNSTIEEGEVVEGALAKAAIDNGFGEECPEDEPVGKQHVARKPAPKAAGKSDKKKADSRKAEGEDE